MGTQVFRVTGTIDGKQRKRQFVNLADAEDQRDAWEIERMSALTAMRPKITRLTQAELIEAEACFSMVKAIGHTLYDAVRFFIRNPPAARCELTFQAGYQQFLEARKKFLSEAQYSNYLSPCKRLSAFLGDAKKLAEIQTSEIEEWLTSLNTSPKSWNNYRGDLAVVFNWFSSPPRRWITENPVSAVSRHRRRDTLPGNIETLSCETARDLMRWLETEMPHWVTYFTLALFAGIRPDRDDGEMGKLADAVAKFGADKYFRGNCLFLTADITKDGRPRRIPLPENLKVWLAAYPPDERSLRAGKRAEYAKIRAKWKIPHDGLRHTSISACAALHGITEAAVRHGNSEKICRDNYLALFPRAEAEEFFGIRPNPRGEANDNRATRRETTA